MHDYDLALNYLLWGHFNDLFTLMMRTRDDMLGKKIHLFLHSVYYATEHKEIIDTHDELMMYIDHAAEQEGSCTLR